VINLIGKSRGFWVGSDQGSGIHYLNNLACNWNFENTEEPSKGNLQ
jgi:hypothetical protein